MAKKKSQMQAAPLPKITTMQAHQSMIGAWRILDELKVRKDYDRPLYVELHEIVDVEGNTVFPVPQEQFMGTIMQIVWASRLGLLRFENFVWTMPETTVKWFVEHSHHWTQSNRDLQLDYLRELFKGKAEIVEATPETEATNG
jgi:hypothetical protein